MAEMSPLRRRMIEDMTVRNLSPATQRSYLNAGVFGSPSNIDLLARGAVYGQMLGVEHELNPGTLVGTEPGGTTFTVPPDQNNLVLNSGDVLNVNNHGTASNTVINAGGVENINQGGSASNTTVNSGGVFNVEAGGLASETMISGGVENVMGQSILTAITNSGVENVEPGGVEDGPVFIGGGVLKLSDPHQLGGKIQFLGPEAAVIDFVNTQVTEVGGLTKLNQILYEVPLTYGDHQTSGVIIQSDFNILVALQADGHGGPELTIQTNQSSTDVIGIQHQLEHPAVLIGFDPVMTLAALLPCGFPSGVQDRSPGLFRSRFPRWPSFPTVRHSQLSFQFNKSPEPLAAGAS